MVTLSPQSDVTEVVKQLGVCGQKKSYLREFCAVVMGDLVERCGEEVVRECIVPGVDGVEKGWEGCTPETLYLLLLLEQHYGKARYTSLPLLVKTFSKCCVTFSYTISSFVHLYLLTIPIHLSFHPYIIQISIHSFISIVCLSVYPSNYMYLPVCQSTYCLLSNRFVILL